MTLAERIRAKGPKKLLALDGGGIRGLLTIEVLAKIESLLRKELGRGESFVLADYFDYIGGTSTGAIIASCLSYGLSVDQIRRFYVENAERMFEKTSYLQRWRSLYKNDYLTAKLKDILREKDGTPALLGTKRLRTLLMMVMRNASTDSPWPLSNNPAAKYNSRRRPDCNLDLPLWQLVRASTAAPVFFAPERVRIGPSDFVFVDGGVTVYNNPAFQLFLMATAAPYKLEWPAGEKEMLLVSIGTGTNPEELKGMLPPNIASDFLSVPDALMYSALNEQDLLCRTFGRCLAGERIDGEIGDLRADLGRSSRGPVPKKLFTYVRYTAELTRAGLNALGLPKIDPAKVRSLDSFKGKDALQAIGRAVAERRVKAAHFKGFV